MTNYTVLRKIRKPIIVNDHKDLPPGDWRPVAEAARLRDRSRETIYTRFYRGRIEGYQVGSNGSLLVNIDKIF